MVSGFSIAFTFRFLEKKLKQHRLRDMLVLKGRAERDEGKSTRKSRLFYLIIDM